MSTPPSNLGRGLGDLINEVSQVKAVPSQISPPPPAQAEAPPPAPSAQAEVPAPRRVKRPILVWSLAAAVLAMTGVAGFLGRELWAARHPAWRPKGEIEVDLTDPLTPMLIQEDGVVPALPDWAHPWADSLKASGAEMTVDRDSVRVKFNEPLFIAGIMLREDGPIQSAARALAAASGLHILVLGHTSNDALPAGGAYRSLDDLAFARAVAVVHALRAEGVTADLLAGTGPAPFSNDDPAERAKNRTVTLRIRARR